MTDRERLAADPPSARSMGANDALDWVDLLVIVGIAAGVSLLSGATGWRPPGPVLGAAFAPLVLAALAFRRRVLPPRRRGPVLKRLTVLGVLSVALMIAGLLVGLFGALGASLQLREEAAPVNEADVQMLARSRAALENLPKVERLSPDDPAAHGDAPTGTFEELMALVDRAPSEEAIARHAAEARRELEAEAEERAKARRDGGIAFALRVALLAGVLIAVGGWLDARRPRAPA